LNRELEMQLPVPVSLWFENLGTDMYLDPHLKTFLLLQAHFSRSALPIADYVTDTISVLDNCVRVTQAMIDYALLKGSTSLVLGLMRLLQCLKQGLWPTDSPLLQLPHVTNQNIKFADEKKKISLLQKFSKPQLESLFSSLNSQQSSQIFNSLKTFPSPKIEFVVLGGKEKQGRWYINKSKKISIDCRIKTGTTCRSNLIQANLPRFPKQQTEGWVVIVSHDSYNRVLAMKRLLSASDMKTKLDIVLGDEYTGDLELNLGLISDCYLGVDMNLKISLTLVE
jgi:Sec63 Brl domain